MGALENMRQRVEQIDQEMSALTLERDGIEQALAVYDRFANQAPVAEKSPKKTAVQSAKPVTSKVQRPPEPAAPAKRKVPEGTKFRLRESRNEGKYLHESGDGLAADTKYAWIGTEKQLLAARQHFEAARDLVEVPVVL